MALNNFGIVEYTKLYRGAQPDEKGFNDLWRLGVREVLTLNGSKDREYGWQGQTMSRPMNGLETANEIESIVSDLRKSLESGRAVFVHCTYGRDRTGAVIGAYRIIEDGWNFSKMDEERRLMYGEAVVKDVEGPIAQALHELAAKRGLDY